MPDETSIDRRRAGGSTVRPWDLRIAELASAQHGVVGRRQLAALGMSRDAIDGRVARGSLHPIHLGVYAVGRRELSREGRWFAAVLACGDGAVLSHRSAGCFWSLIPGYSGFPEVSRSGGRAPRRAGIVTHGCSLRPDEARTENAIPVTSPFRTLVDLAAILKPRQLERAMHEAEVLELRDPLSLADLLERYPRRRGAANLRAVLASGKPVGVTRNEFEEAFVALLDAHSLPRPLFNATLPIRGTLLEPDCMWPRQRLLVELDGGAVHRTALRFESDRQRDRVLLTEGWRSTRVTWRQLEGEPEQIAADLRELLRAKTGPPTL